MKQKKHSSRKQKRPGTGKVAKKPHRNKKKPVLSTAEEPSEHVFKNGKVCQFDLLCNEGNIDAIPRKTREFMARMNRWNAPQTEAPRGNGQSKSNADSVATPARDDASQAKKREELKRSPKNASSGKKFEGMKQGESLSEYSTRLRKESRQMAIDIAKKGNHQAEKRKAYNKKCRERAAKRKGRRRGEYNDEEIEDDGGYNEGTTQSISHLPAYWQEIVNNNGRPVSVKKRRRDKRLEEATTPKSSFGDQVEQPPDLTVLPVRRNKTAMS